MNQRWINPLEILAFRRLSPQDKKLLQKNHPDLYTYLQNLNESRMDYKTFTQLHKYSKQCKPDKIPNLTKKELIACLYRKLPYLNEIKRRGGMQYQQFLSSFLNTLRWKKGIFTHESQSVIYDTSNFLYGNISNPGRINESYPPWDPYFEVDVDYIQGRGRPGFYKHATQWDFVTVDIFIKMVKILYPKFHDQDYIDDLVSKCDLDRRKFAQRFYTLDGKSIGYNTRVLSLAKLRVFLMLVGETFAKEVYSDPRLNNTLTQEEKEFYHKDFKFSYDQINRFMLAIPKEIYVDFLLNSDKRYYVWNSVDDM